MVCHVPGGLRKGFSLITLPFLPKIMEKNREGMNEDLAIRFSC